MQNRISQTKKKYSLLFQCAFKIDLEIKLDIYVMAIVDLASSSEFSERQKKNHSLKTHNF